MEGQKVEEKDAAPATECETAETTERAQDGDQEAKDPEDDFHIDPNSYVNTTGKEIDYTRLIKRFGCEPVNDALLDRLERLIGQPVHPLLRRGIIISHRDFGIFLDHFERKEPIYLYTGRGPSSEAMHLGHLLPFILTKWLQDVFKCPLVIQMSDDEKFFFQREDACLPLSHFAQLAIENSKDIIACGFDPERTFIFRNTDFIGYLYPNVATIQKLVNYNQIRSIFGLTGSENIGRISFAALETAPCLSTSFPFIFGDDPAKLAFCLVPYGIDQDPYFRMARDISARLNCPKPSAIHTKFFPGLKGFNTKMSSSDPTTAIFLTDSAAEIKRKVNKYAFSGGKESTEEHRRLGADLDVDIPYNYLRFFHPDDARLAEVAARYQKGEMLTGEVKALLIEVLQKLVSGHQEARESVTLDVVKQFMKIRSLKLR